MIEVRSAEGQGRGYFAKEDGVISAGTIVLESSAIVAVVKDGQEDKTCRRGGCGVCDHCCCCCRRLVAEVSVELLWTHARYEHNDMGRSGFCLCQSEEIVQGPLSCRHVHTDILL